MKQKTILIISQKLSGGGAERVASNLSIELPKRTDCRVFLALFDGADQTYPAGCEVINMEVGPVKGKAAKLFQTIRRILKLRKIKKDYQVDIALSLLTSPNLVNVCSKYKEKVVVSERNLISNSAGSKMAKAVVKYVCKKADYIISLSKMVEKDLIDNFGTDPGKICTVYNSCDGERLLALSEQANVEIPAFPYVVTMGRLMRQKGQWHLIRAFSVLHERFPNLKLIILGEGEYYDSLKEMIHHLKLDDSVVLYGYVKSPHSIIKHAKAFLFTSLFEGLGNVLLEAMACGVPIVSADCVAGPREILTGDIFYEGADASNGIEFAQYGILTKAFDPKDQPDFTSAVVTKEELIFAEAVTQLLSSDSLQAHFHEQSLLRSKDFSEDAIISSWIEAIEK